MTPVLGGTTTRSFQPAPHRRRAHRRCVPRDGKDPVLLLKNVARTLKPQGRIGIIDYREVTAAGSRRRGARPSELRRGAGRGRRPEARRRAQVSALSIFPDFRAVARHQPRTHANRAHDCGKRFNCRRRHSGGPEDIRCAGCLRRVGRHSRHRRRARQVWLMSSRCLPTRAVADRSALGGRRIAAVKTGMLATAESWRPSRTPLAAFSSRTGRRPRYGQQLGSAGCTLLAPEAVSKLRTLLLP